MNEASIEPSAVTWFDSPVGPLIAVATDEAICALHFSDHESLESELATWRVRCRSSAHARSSQLLQELRRQAEAYFSGELREFTVPLAYEGSAFQKRVWEVLREIPYGQTRSYLDIATRIGDPGATRAVGAANGMNPLAIVIPCHRVINEDGQLGGYGGGLWRKRILLDLERGQGRLDL
ncbi:MAG TPA: methylated-DNA--[protein]-cysteine S-methyltransferase [Steroidobacter sp.]